MQRSNAMRPPVIARIALILALLIAGSFAAAQSSLAQPVPLPPGSARIAVVHAAPFDADLADTTVTVVASVPGQSFLLTNDFQFGETIPYTVVPAGTYQVSIYAGSLTLPIASGTTPVVQEVLTVAPDTSYTVLAVGTSPTGADPYPVELQVLTDTPGVPGAGSVRARAVHVAPFAPTGPADTAVDVLFADNTPTGITNLRYPEATPFIDLPTGVPLNLKVVLAGQTAALIPIPEFTLTPDGPVTLIALGGANGYAPSVLAFNPEQAPARVRFVHAAPFAPGAAEVTVNLNGQPAASGFGFGEQTFYRTLPAGIYVAQVLVGTTPALMAPLVVESGKSYTVVAQGVSAADANFPLTLNVLTDDNTAAPDNEARVRVLHAAPFGGNVAATAVDVVSEPGNTPVPGLTNVLYNQQGVVTVPSGVAIDLKVTPAGQPTAPALIDVPPLTLGSGDAYTVIAISRPDGSDATVLLLDDRQVVSTLRLPFVTR
jgi:hypothetical protein